MMMTAYEFQLFTPRFDSDLVTLVLELEHLCRLQTPSTTHPKVFLQLKRLFHVLESVGSARIEGNNTTVAEYIELKESNTRSGQESEEYQEIQNIELALQHIESIGNDRPITEHFLRELHALVVQGLSVDARGEGDSHAGTYREYAVRISGSKHTPPAPYLVPKLLSDLTQFINRKDKPQFDLIKIAQAHHRFVWIHPFGNGNGRTARLLTYAMLMRAGFKVEIEGRIVNPTAIFCSNRDDYYRMLGNADDGTPQGLESWCTYVLSGLQNELQKESLLRDYSYLSHTILLPAIRDAWTNGRIDQETASVLEIVAKKQVVMNKDLKPAFESKAPSTISRKIKEYVEAGLLTTEEESGRKYVLSFSNRLIMPSVTKQLAIEGFLPAPLV